ncbi:MAG: SGNH/GDSL hydrolase family protein [Candidatus Nitrosoabyssus spongiisocia]|nr:MAG: SGNH/GDSL hydrolase family protein [Nitrosopumilaceae archaeon AB1(1)]
MSVQISYKKQTLFFIFLILIVLVIVEGVIRYMDTYAYDCNFTNHELFKNYTRSELEELCQNYTFKFDYSDNIRRLIPLQGSYVNINSEGYRGAEFNFNDDDYKVFFLGGSTAFGSGASGDNFTIPSLLEKKFDDTGVDIIVINAGISGATSYDERYYLENYILKYSPNIIIMYDGWNDLLVQNNLTYDERVLLFGNNKPNTGIVALMAKLDYRTGVGIGSYIRELYITNTQVKINLQETQNGLYENWSEVCKIGTQNNFQTINILQPIIGTSNRTISQFESINTDLRDSMLALNLNSSKYYPCDKIYDLRNAFAGMDGVTIYYDDGHTIDFGNEIIADQIFKIIYPVVTADMLS